MLSKRNDSWNDIDLLFDFSKDSFSCELLLYFPRKNLFPFSVGKALKEKNHWTQVTAVVMISVLWNFKNRFDYKDIAASTDCVDLWFPIILNSFSWNVLMELKVFSKMPVIKAALI